MRWRRSLEDVHDRVEDLEAEADYPRFAPVASQEFDYLRDLPECQDVQPGSRLLEQGNTPSSVHLVCSGLLRLSYLGAEGTERTLGLRTSGWFAGAAAAIMQVPSVCSATCIGPCVVKTIPSVEFSLRLMQNAKLLRHFIRTMCSEITAQASAQVQLMSSSAEDRLECFLRECQTKDTRWNVVDPLPMLKQMELAQLLAIKPETLSRIIRKRMMSKGSPESAMKPSAREHRGKQVTETPDVTIVRQSTLSVGVEAVR